MTAIPDNNEDYGDIPVYSSKECPDDYDFMVSTSCPTGYRITFNLSITDNNLTVWTDSFNVSVGLYGPEVRYVTNIIDDSEWVSSMNISNGQANPGEMIMITVPLTNKGDTDAHSVTALLSTSDPNALIFIDTAEYGDIALDSTNVWPMFFGFLVWVAPMAPDNHVVTFDLIPRDSNLTTWTDQFTIVIKHLPEPHILMNDQSLDDDMIGESSGNDDGIVSPGEDIELKVTLQNIGKNATNVSAVLSTTDSYITMNDNTEQFNNIPYLSFQECLDDFDFSVSNTTPFNHEIPFVLSVSDHKGNAWTNEFTVKVIKPFIPSGARFLLVDDDMSELFFSECIDYYTNALNACGYSYDTWTVDHYNEVPASIMTQYQAVIWFTGDNFIDTFSFEDRENVAEYLTNGGRMFLTGQDVGWDIGDYSFYSNYLYARYVKDDVNLYQVDGIASDPISDGMSLSIKGGDGADNQYYPSEIDPIAPADTIFIYNKSSYASMQGKGYDPKRNAMGPAGISSSGTAGLKVDTGNYRLVYFTFGLEAIDNFTDRSNTMKKVIEWLLSTNTPSTQNTGPFYVATNGNDSDNGSFANPFATIQKAVDVMKGGIPACTVATCYIYPGTYSEQVVINSNNNPGYMVITKASNIRPVVNGTNVLDKGFTISNANNIMISGLTIK